MFYSQVILARKGPLGKIWLAAHFDKKLTKNQILATDIPTSVDSVLNPASPLALRVSGHLMLGIVRIYSRKVKYLLTDCTEAMWKIKLAFRPGNVDIDPALLVNLNNIDDPRFFGNVAADNDFPELENTAFPQFLLTNYTATTRVQKPNKIAADNGKISSNSSVTGDEFNAERRRQSLLNKMEKTGTMLTTSGKNQNRVSTSSVPPVNDDLPEYDEGIDFMSFTRGGSSVGGSLGGGSFMTFAGDSASKGPRPPAMTEEEQREHDQQAMLMMEQGMDMDGAYDGNYNAEEMAQLQLAEEEGEQGGGAKPKTKKRPTAAEKAAAAAEEEEEGEDESVVEKPEKPAKRNSKKRRVVIDDRVELSTALIKQRMADLSPILRRRADDPLPCKLLRRVGPRVRYEDQDEETCWEHVLPGGREEAARLTLEDKLLLPASVRSLCPQLQELFRLSTSNEYSLPFPLKEGISRESTGTNATIATQKKAIKDKKIADKKAQTGSPTAPADESAPLPDYSHLAGEVQFGTTEGEFQLDEEEMMRMAMEQQDAGADFGDYETHNAPVQGGLPSSASLFGDSRADGSFGGSFGGTLKDSRGSKGRDLLRERGVVFGDSRYVTSMNEISEKITIALEQSVPSTATSSTQLTQALRAEKDRSVDRGLNERTRAVLEVLEDTFEAKVSISFDEMTSGVSKRSAASAFLEVLHLKTRGLIDAQQEEPFGVITLMPRLH